MQTESMVENVDDYYHLDESNNNEKLHFFHTFIEALSIFKKNINFISFSILYSIPYFCFLVLFEIVRQRTFIDTVSFLKQPRSYSVYYWYDDWPVPYSESISLVRYISHNLIYLVVLYLIPYNLVELFSTILTVHFASRISTERNLNPISLKEMIKTSNQVKFKGPFITSLYVLFLSTATLIGLFYILDVVITLTHMAAFVTLMVKYLEWSVGWNMSIVISVLNEDSGLDAFDRSAYYSKGSDKRQGSILMLVFFIWGFALRLPCMFAGCSCETIAGIGFTAVYSGLICIGTVLKWVVFLVYYFDCKKRVLEKKFDEEVGTKPSPELSGKM
ncbi:hypothetical protein ACFE04_024279 [Oxalis oulophora]